MRLASQASAMEVEEMEQAVAPAIETRGGGHHPRQCRCYDCSFLCSFLFFTHRLSTDSLLLFYHLLPISSKHLQPKHSFSAICYAWSLYPVSFLPLTDVFSSSCTPDCTALSLLLHRPTSFYIRLSSPTRSTAWSLRRVSIYLNRRYSLYFPLT